MPLTNPIGGVIVQGDTPNWAPLLNLAPSDVDEFMWMFEIELDDGTRVHAYKHWETRRYLHLGREGRAFVYREDGFYDQVAPLQLLNAVLKRG